jgi:hypothetical protein
MIPENLEKFLGIQNFCGTWSRNFGPSWLGSYQVQRIFGGSRKMELMFFNIQKGLYPFQIPWNRYVGSYRNSEDIPENLEMFLVIQKSAEHGPEILDHRCLGLTADLC